MSEERLYTHNMCGISGCTCCHCHHCVVALEEEVGKLSEEVGTYAVDLHHREKERDEARQVARDFFAVLKRIAPLETHDDYLETRYDWLREAKEMR